MDRVEFKRFLLNFKNFLTALTFLCVSFCCNASSKTEPDLSYQSYTLNLKAQAGSFQIFLHFPRAKESLALVLSQVMKERLAAICDYFQTIPQAPIYVVIKARANEANGSATVFPYNLIMINDFPPLGQEHLAQTWQWQSNLIIHEFTHILHMDQTHGVLSGLRRVWGSAAKWGGIVPRWFIEGIAVWAETYFSSEGRLRDSRFKTAAKLAMSMPGSCLSLDCLDSPGHFPQDSYAYWVGASFMEYLEKEQAGSIRCLVRANSDNVPFRLDHAFKECLGKNIKETFTLFRDSVRGTFQKEEESINWQKGTLFAAGNFFYVTYSEKKRREYLRMENMLTGEKKSWALPRWIEALQDWDSARGMPLLSVFRRGARDISRELWLYDLAKNKKSESLGRKDHYQRFLPNGARLGIRYEHGWWNIYHYPAGAHPESDEEEEKALLTRFTLETNLLSPVVTKNHQLFFLTAQADKKNYELWGLNLAEKNALPQRWWKKSSPLSYWGKKAEELFYYESSATPQMWALSPEKKQVRKVAIPLTGTLLDGHIHQEQVMVQTLEEPQKMTYLPAVSWPTTAQVEVLTPTAVENASAPLTLPEGVKSGAYLPLSAFVPSYWLLMYQAAGGLNGIRTMTTLTDPVGKVHVDLSEAYFSSIGKDAPEVGVTLRHSLFSGGARYEQDYYRITATRVLNFRESKEASFGFFLPLGDITSQTKVFYWSDRYQDFLSTRKQEKVGPVQEFSYQSSFLDLGLSQWNFKTQFFRQKTRTFNAFWGVQSRVRGLFSFNQNHGLEGLLTYGRLFKSGLRSGILLAGGGGQDFVFGPSFHEFYGLLLGDLYGNFALTSRLQYEAVLGRPYKGRWPWPLFLKEAQLLSGLSYAHPEYAFTGNSRLQSPHLYSVHLGTRLKMNWFYLLPVDTDLILAKVVNDIPYNDPLFLFMLRSEFF